MTRKKLGPRQRAIAKGYRSGLEEKVGEQLKKLKINAEYESFKIPYVVPVIHRTYIRFVFSNSRTKLRKGAKSNYGEWCKKHGFIYADKEVPHSRVKEKSKLKSINIVERLKQEQKK